MKQNIYSLLLTGIITMFATFQVNGQISFQQANQRLANPGIHSGCPVTVIDCNNDGLDDIIRLDEGHDAYVQIQKPNQQFETRYLGDFGGSSGWAWAMAVADVDHNGYKDILAGGGSGSTKLLMMMSNTGTMASIITLPNSNFFLQNATFADFNNDGWIDLFCCDDNAGSHMYLNDGTGILNTSTLVSFEVNPGVFISGDPADSGNYGSAWIDFDNDGDMDLYVAHCRQSANSNTDLRRKDRLFVNDGSNNFTEQGSLYGIEVSQFNQTWTASFGDIDNDGDLDLFVTNHDVPCQILQNDGTGHYTDITASTLLTIDVTPIESVMEDFDNDGYLDIFVTGGDARLWRNNGDGTFSQENSLFNSDEMESFAVGDINHDGFTDIYASYATIYTNPSNIDDVIWLNRGNSNHFLTIDLEGTISNIDAIGARALVYGDWGVQLREVRAGESYGTNNSGMLHFGLGSATEIDSVEIKWPSGISQTIISPAIDQFISVIEANCVSPEVSISPASTPYYCTGQTFDLTATPGYNYVWQDGSTSNIFTVNQTGEYLVTVTAPGNNCPAVTPVVKVIAPPNETPAISALGETIFCEGGSVTLEGPAGLASYTWSNTATTQSISVTQSGSYFLTTPGVCNAVSSAPIEINVLSVSDPVTSDVSIPVPGTANLNATGNNVAWYTVPVGGTPVAYGNAFTTPVLNSTTTYYVEDRLIYGGEQDSGGIMNYSGTSPYSPNYIDAATYFDVFKKCTLESVKVYTGNAGIRRFDLYDGNGILLDSVSVDIVQLDPDSQIVNLNFQLEPGTNYRLETDSNSNKLLIGLGGTIGPRFKRINTGVFYPYSDTVFSITGNSWSTSAYYYFFNWKMKLFEVNCQSDRDTATVTITSGVGLHELSEAGIHIYPNPVHDKLTIELNNPANNTITLFDQTGRKIMQEIISMKENTLDVSNLEAGIYSLRVENEKGKFISKVIIY